MPVNIIAFIFSEKQNYYMTLSSVFLNFVTTLALVLGYNDRCCWKLSRIAVQLHFTEMGKKYHNCIAC